MAETAAAPAKARGGEMEQQRVGRQIHWQIIAWAELIALWAKCETIENDPLLKAW